MNKNAVSVIICAYTEARWYDLVDAVASLQQQTLAPHEIILVIDHNQPMLQRVLNEISGVIAVENSERQGLSGARNSGIAQANGSLIAFLDDDATAEPDWLARLVACCEDPLVLGAGGTVQPYWLGENPTWFPKEFYWVIGCSYQSRPPEPIEVRNPYGGCTCMRRELFETVGGFRDGIGRVGTRPLGGEETELSIRAHQHWPERVFLYEPQAQIHHRIVAQRTTWSYFRARCYAEGLSKAVIARYVGSGDGLASERAYTLRNLPRGVVRNLRQGFQQRDLAAFQRAGAILAGFCITAAGYVAGTFSQNIELQKIDTLPPIIQRPAIPSGI